MGTAIYFLLRAGETSHWHRVDADEACERHHRELVLRHAGELGGRQLDDLRTADAAGGVGLLAWLGERDARGIAHLRRLVTDGTPVADLPLLPSPPTGLTALDALGRLLLERLATAGPNRRSPRRGKRS